MYFHASQAIKHIGGAAQGGVDEHTQECEKETAVNEKAQHECQKSAITAQSNTENQLVDGEKARVLRSRDTKHQGGNRNQDAELMNHQHGPAHLEQHPGGVGRTAQSGTYLSDLSCGSRHIAHLKPNHNVMEAQKCAETCQVMSVILTIRHSTWNSVVIL